MAINQDIVDRALAAISGMKAADKSGLVTVRERALTDPLGQQLTQTLAEVLEVEDLGQPAAKLKADALRELAARLRALGWTVKRIGDELICTPPRARAPRFVKEQPKSRQRRRRNLREPPGPHAQRALLEESPAASEEERQIAEGVEAGGITET
jgi:hypothetical protein